MMFHIMKIGKKVEVISIENICLVRLSLPVWESFPFSGVSLSARHSTKCALPSTHAALWEAPQQAVN